MITLSGFVGQLMTDLAFARTGADYAAVSIGEQYHADPFVRALPIPHYMIDEAEIEVPVVVVGISKESDSFLRLKTQIFGIISEKLPIIILRSYKYNYVREREDAEANAESKRNNEEKIREENGNYVNRVIKRESPNILDALSESLLREFTNSAGRITKKINVHTAQYMDSYNYEILKLLDLTEDFAKQLVRELKTDVGTYKEENRPFLSDDAIRRAANYIGNLMFFEFKSVMRSDAGVNIDINTVQMNEYATKDCLMRLKIKIKEQDFNLLVEDGGNGKEKRYLSLT